MSQRTSPPNNTPSLSLALLLVLTAFDPLALPALAQTPAPSFSPPNVVPNGTTVKVDGSSSMATINRALKKAYEKKYEGTSVTLTEDGSDAALKALVEGKVDLAAIGRALTPEEKQQGLVTAPIARHKIAIIVSPNNPFTGNLTFEQFAKIFRGDIKDWSELGGAPGAIRFVDRPAFSDTRQAFRPYPVFQKAPFKTGEKTQQTAKDDTSEVVQALGTDGIGYAIAAQVSDRKDVRIVSMHKTLPDDPRYPFSQPLAYVYKGTPGAAVVSFLGVAMAPESQPIIEAARATGTTTAAASSVPISAPVSSTNSLAVSPSPAASATTDVASVPPDTEARSAFPWWLLLIPLLGILLWFWLKGRRTDAPATPPTDTALPDRLPTPPTATPSIVPLVPEVLMPEAPVSGLSSGAAAIADGAIPAAGAAGLAGLTGTDTGESAAVDLPPLIEPPIEPPTVIVPPAAIELPIETAPLVEVPFLDSPSLDRPSLDAVPAENLADSGIPGAALLVGGAAIGTELAAVTLGNQAQTNIEAAKYNVGQTDLSSEALASVDEGLPDLPDGYGESRIVLMPRDPQWGYAYWDIPDEHREERRRQGGQRLALRLYDITDVDLNHHAHSLQQYDCDELARDWYVPIPVSDRDYIAEIGYLTGDGRWLLLARSHPVRIPPVYPSDWLEDHFTSVVWDDDRRDTPLLTLLSPAQRTSAQRTAASDSPLYDQIFGMAQSTEALRVAGSLFGSMQHIAGSVQQMPSQAVSSYVFPSGIGLGVAPGVPGFPGFPGVPTMSGLTMSGMGMSGMGMGAIQPLRARKFWLVADAELIVYGATEPDATVTIDGRPIQLNLDGTFRFQLSFQDGVLNFPIIAVAADGEQSRSIHMTFDRETPHRQTNTKDEAVDKWF